MKRKIWHFGIVTGLFLLSLIPRLKNIQTGDFPTVIPHLQVLQTIQVWDEVGPQQHAFLPVQTWANPNDKFITYFSRLENEKGDNYYVSYPPFAFVLAWFFCKIFGLPFSVLSITILNLILQYIAAFAIFGITKKILPTYTKYSFFWPGIVAAAVFICNPASMRIFSQVYFSESVGTSLLCLFFYFAVSLSINPRNFLQLLGMCFSLFLLVYTEWVGLFAGLFFCLYWVFKSFSDVSYRKLAFIAGAAMLFAVLLFGYQLYLISDGNGFVQNIHERFMARSGMRDKEKSVGDTVFKDGFWEWILSDFRVTFFASRWFLPVLVILSMGYWIKNKRSEKSISVHFILFLLILLSVAGNFFALFNFSIMHSYTWVKWGIPLGLVLAYCFYAIQSSKIATGFGIVMALALFTTDLFFYQGFSSKDQAPPYWEELTAFVKQEAKDTESIYITTVSNEIDPTFYLTYYTGRNLMNVQREEDAMKHAQSIGRSHWVWFYFNENEGRKEAYHK